MSNDGYQWLRESPVGQVMRAVLSKGLGSLPRNLRRALMQEDVSRALAMANEAYGRSASTDRDDALIYAVLLIERGLLDEAMGVIRRALQEHAQDVGLQLVQVLGLKRRGDIEGALGLMEALESVSALEARHWRLMGDIYLDMDREPSARQAYEKALDKGMEDREVAYRLAHLHEEQGNLDGAAHYQWLAANWAGDSAMMWEMAAELCYEVGRVEEAVEGYQRLTGFHPQDPQNWFMLGLSKWYVEDLKGAAKAFERVVDLHPTHLVAWRQLGTVELELGRGERALYAFEQALDIDDGDREALMGATLASREIGDVEAALGWAERARDVAPQDREIQQLYAVVILDRGKSQQAVELLEELCGDQGAIQSPECRGALAVAHLLEGKVERSIEEMDQAVRQDVEPTWVIRFAEGLLRARGVSATAEWLDEVELGTPGWPLVKAMMRFVCAALSEDASAAKKALQAFADGLEGADEVLPVAWGLEAWEALSYRFERAYQGPFDALLDVLEGRSDPDEFDVSQWTTRII